MLGKVATVFGLLASIVIVVTFLTGIQNLKDFFGLSEKPHQVETTPADSNVPSPVVPASATTLTPAIAAPVPASPDSTAPSRTSYALVARTFSPSFSCSVDIGVVEQAICADPELSAKDRDMARLYFRARSERSGEDRKRLIQAQRDWLQARSNCHEPGLSKCVSDLFDSRIPELQALAGN